MQRKCEERFMDEEDEEALSRGVDDD